ncbi:MAG: ABC transporter ATP-binding protein [Legionellales bacterium]|nr:ABC transporter ATP-binding protein [Legionellales bacterium]
MTIDNLFTIKNLKKTHFKGGQEINIFHDLNMHIEEGNFIAIMGPSGSGKTTMLNMLGGIDKPTSGEIYFKQERVDNLSENELTSFRSSHVGFIFQFYNLMPMLTAFDNVELPLMLTNLTKKEKLKKVSTALEIVSLSERATYYPKELSGGQMQRVAIARSIVSNPDILLCDEPTGDLDRLTANEILEVLKLLNSELNKTIVMVTHDPEAARYSKLTLHLDKGEFNQKDLSL